MNSTIMITNRVAIILIISIAGSAMVDGAEMVTKYGRLEEVTVNTIQAERWLKTFFDRQATGLGGNPQMSGYPFDTKMFQDVIATPPGHYGGAWWPYEQTGYYLDGIIRAGYLGGRQELIARGQANINWVLANPQVNNILALPVFRWVCKESCNTKNMSDPKIYTQLLRLSAPWYIARLEVDVPGEEVHVFIDHRHVQMPCPTCGRLCNVRDHTEERLFRHLDLWQCKTWLHARLPRTDCQDHGVLRVTVPWAEPGSRFSQHFEGQVILALQACKTVTGASQLMRISWEEASGIMTRAVARSLLRRDEVNMPHLAVDEKSYGRGGKKFVTILMDLQRGIVHGTSPGRSKDSLTRLLKRLNITQENAVTAIAMDMHDPYREAVRDHFSEPGPAIVHDRFHIAKHMNEALNDVRVAEAKALAKNDDDTLVGTRQLWLWGKENLPKHRQAEFAKLKRSDLATAEVWAQKENLRRLWNHPTTRAARSHFKDWAAWVRKAGRARVIKVADMIESRLEDVISNCEHPISSGPMEGMNSIIMAIQRAGRGYRHAETFGVAILFFCGGLNLAP